MVIFFLHTALAASRIMKMKEIRLKTGDPSPLALCVNCLYVYSGYRSSISGVVSNFAI